MLTLSHPTIKKMNCIDGDEPFVNISGLDGRIAVDSSRQLITSRSGYFSWVRADVAQRLVAAARLLPREYQLLVVEGYRPLEVQRKYFDDYTATLREAHAYVDEAALYEMVSKWVAPPDVGGHPAGAALDLTLQFADGRHVEMGSVVNANDAESSGACYTDSSFITREAAKNRTVLFTAMSAAGFVNYPSEWWHWSYGDRYRAVVNNMPFALYGPVEETAFLRDAVHDAATSARNLNF
ncbi:peptidase M15D, vanX D-ala-D-ala dipeptidase [Caballeronia arvi]|uniref:D-alanyl-D-alanine dipeptidase n=1 Tax=Caballeronia arvi TaxID=1777135 RepID=A0A158JU65_9BURK|nr:M15 family metallopeptidase [Caballeronia arvi]SAL71830.1 peptidase M15D, vanX D-ala-D-ala dipeptidase [Caballeronia arvi]